MIKDRQQDIPAEQELHPETMLNKAMEGPSEPAKDNEVMANIQERINQQKSETKQAQNIILDPIQQEQTHGNGTQPKAHMHHAQNHPQPAQNTNPLNQAQPTLFNMQYPIQLELFTTNTGRQTM